MTETHKITLLQKDGRKNKYEDYSIAYLTVLYSYMYDYITHFLLLIMYVYAIDEEQQSFWIYMFTVICLAMVK